MYVSSGEIEEIMEETIKVHVSEGDNNGESIVFDTSEASIPQEASVNSTVTVTYYLKENTYYALSVSCTEHLASLLDIPSWIVYYIKEV